MEFKGKKYQINHECPLIAGLWVKDKRQELLGHEQEKLNTLGPDLM